jgi:hypothetical protein
MFALRRIVDALVSERVAFLQTKTDDPEVKARRRHVLRSLLEADPEFRQALVDELRPKEVERGRRLLCEQLYERRLGRALSEGERATLRDRWAELGPGRLGDVLFDSSPQGLADWLADSEGR